MKRIAEQRLLERIVTKLTDSAVPWAHAQIIARVLVYADAAGISSHGTIRLPHYLRRLQHGGINLDSKYNITVARYPWAMLLDAAGGWGHVATEKAAMQCMELAKQFGIAAINIQNSSHCGALSYYLRLIAAQGYLGMIAANTDAIVVPTGSKEPFFGTNPLGFCFPTLDPSNPVIIDMATSAGALGKILSAREQGQNIPKGWAVDAQGVQTDNPEYATALLPMAGHKGYSLAFMVETFAAILAGAAFGPHIVPMYKELDKLRNLSVCILLMESDIYLPKGESDGFANHMAQMIGELHCAQTVSASEPIMVPGEPEWRCLQQSREKGVLVLESICKFLGL